MVNGRRYFTRIETYDFTGYVDFAQVIYSHNMYLSLN